MQLERIEHRVLVYYCRSLVRGLDLLEHQSAAPRPVVDVTQNCKGSPDNKL